MRFSPGCRFRARSSPIAVKNSASPPRSATASAARKKACRKHSLIFRPSHKKTPSCRNISRARRSAARFWQRTALCTGQSATTGCANTPLLAGLRAAARAFRGRIYVRTPKKLCGKPAFPALRCSNSNAARTARPGSWKLTPASGVRSRSRARPGRILPTAGSVWRQTFPYRKSSPQPLCAWSTIRRTLPRRSVISGQESPGSFSPCCVTL